MQINEPKLVVTLLGEILHGLLRYAGTGSEHDDEVLGIGCAVVLA